MNTVRLDENPDLSVSCDVGASTLVVVGAGGGMGRWLCAHLFSKHSWRGVVLLDENVNAQFAQSSFTCPVQIGILECGQGRLHAYDVATRPIDLSGPAVFCLTVPQANLSALARSLLPLLHQRSVVFELSASKSAALGTLRSVRPDLAVFGVHPLCSPAVSSLDGQTIVVCPSESHPNAHLWLVDLIRTNGGLIEISPPEKHDEIMSYVQIAAHQALLSFVEVLRVSDYSIDYLWKYRTPLFELMLTLCSRLLSPSQGTTIASIQLATDALRIKDEYLHAFERLASLIINQEDQRMQDHIGALRNAFSGALLTHLQEASDLAVAVVQQTRTDLALARRTNALVALERRNDGNHAESRPVIGRISNLSSTAVSIEDLLVGEKGRSSVLTGPGLDNALRLGLSPARKTRLVQLALSHVRVRPIADVLGEWMGSVWFDIRLLVPESVSGEAISVVCGASPGVEGARVISEGVRLGHREVVVRLSVASDQDVVGIAGGVARQVELAYRWPAGTIAKLVATPVSGMCYLGPPGAASGTAAQQAMTLMHLTEVELIERRTLEELVMSVSADTRLLGVIPIVSSSSGLVEWAAEALLGCGPVEAGGLVDVPIRLDAYASKATTRRGRVPIVVYGPPEAIAQCARFVARVGGNTKECESTAAACIEVKCNPDGVALAAFGTGEKYGLHTYERDVTDLSGAITRFLVIARRGLFEKNPLATTPIDRWLWVTGQDPIGGMLSARGRRYVEIIEGGTGKRLIISTKPETDWATGPVAALGCIPWSPRTPVVRVGPQ